MLHVSLSPNGKIDIAQLKNMKFALLMKLCHMIPDTIDT